MQPNRAYTIPQLLFTLFVLAVIAALAIPILHQHGTVRRPARQMQSSTQVRGIIQGLINFSPGNHERFPGVLRGGIEDRRPLAATRDAFGTNETGHHPAYRYTVMLRNNYFSPEYAISPSEMNPDKHAIVLAAGLNLTADHYSFAMLRTDHDEGQGEGRLGEWQSTMNSKAVVVSDRNRSIMAGSYARSVFTAKDPSLGWRGSVGYGDNHVVFETTSLLPGLQYTEDGQALGVDDLFADDKDPLGRDGFDAGMVYQNPWTYVRQW